jgi:SNF2 family DNA or RNA helicase
MTQTQTIEPAEFQIEDMQHLEDRDWSANWSEMGCFKTSTVLWLIPRWARRLEVENPQILIITTRSGKGTFWRHGPIQLPEYELFNLNTGKVKMVMEGHEFDIGGLPNDYSQPRIFVAHYNIFTRRKKKKQKPEDKPTDMEGILEELLDAAAAEAKKESRLDVLEQIKQHKWDIIILDEAHRIKGRSTGWTREIKRLKAPIKHVMTGTGFINNPAEVWSLLNFIEKHEFASYWRFREEYCLEEMVNGFRKIIGIKPDKVQEFRDLMRSVGPRRTKQEVFKNLPDPIYTPFEVELNPAQRRIYDDLRDYLQALDEAGEPIYAPNVLAALQRLRQICVATPRVVRDYYDPKAERRVQELEFVEPSSKLDALMEILDGLEWDEERRDQVVVFSNFKAPIEMAKKRFEPKYDINGRCIFEGISYIEMKQGDSDRTRYQKWAIDFPKKQHQVFICTLQLGSESISLTSATTCVFLDRSWSPKDNDQGVSRVWRPGQESIANIININAKDTVDGRVLAANLRKSGWFKQIFG